MNSREINFFIICATALINQRHIAITAERNVKKKKKKKKKSNVVGVSMRICFETAKKESVVLTHLFLLLQM